MRREMLNIRSKIGLNEGNKGINDFTKPKRENASRKISVINEAVSFFRPFTISLTRETPMYKGFKDNYKRLNEIYIYISIYVCIDMYMGYNRYVNTIYMLYARKSCLCAPKYN